MKQVADIKFYTDIDVLVQAFNDYICPEDYIKTDDSEWDLTATYQVSWACSWNDPRHIGEQVKVHSKNNRLAVVEFVETPHRRALLQSIFRLEDLTKLP